jgi:hypothetical protein
MTQPEPATDQTALRDRIAEALYERERPPRDPHWPDVYLSDREVFEAMADAVLAVLPSSVDRATVLEEAASHLEARAAEFTAAARKDPLAFVKGATDARYRTADCWDAAADELRRLAAASAVVVRRATDETPSARHAPGTAILCLDCRAKGHSVCMGEETPQTAVERAGES